ncbi:cytochrome P450 [Xylariomycetidae sp. FL0641]|nr:cytochrome P450 [Xylariomycetidae sp. FL0641]
MTMLELDGMEVLSWLFLYRLGLSLLVLFVLTRLIARLQAWRHARSVMRRNGCVEPPAYPHKDPIFGLDLFLLYKKAFEERDFLGLNERLFQTYGKTYRAHPQGTPTIKTMDPEITKYVHATYFDHFGVENIRTGIEYLWGDGITVVDGERWAARRRLIKPAFDVAHLANLENRSLAGHVAKFMDLIPRDASTVDLMPLFRRLNLDTASEFIFGEALGALDSADAHREFMDAYFYAQRGCGVRLMLGPRLRLFHRDPKWWAACDTVNGFLDARVDAALARAGRVSSPALTSSMSDTTPRDVDRPRLRLVDEMARATRDRRTLRAQLQNVFTPAHDGAAVTLGNAVLHLSRRAGAWARLRAEVLLPARRRGEPVTYAQLQRYRYLKNVIRETHRVTPISTVIARQCVREVVLPTGGGADGRAPLYVRGGDVVEMHFRCTLRDRAYWGDDADEFRPERWDQEDRKPTWEYTPFGGGPRVCPGFRLAFAEVAYTLVTMARAFKGLESRDDRPWTEETRTTFQNLHGTKVALIPE